MYVQSAIFLLATSTARATAVLAQRAPSSELLGRDIAQGWSLQSGSTPTDAHSCGNGAYCPISLHCNSMVNNHQVAACCSTSSDCRGDVENAPMCADSSWNLWVGYDGNGFCCEGGLVGVYDISKSVAGICVSSNNVGSLRSAILTSTCTGAAATSASVSAASSSSTVAAAATTATTTPAAASLAPSPAKSKSSTHSSTGGHSASTSSGASSSPTRSATSSSSSTPTSNGAEKKGLGMSLAGAAFLAVAAL